MILNEDVDGMKSSKAHRQVPFLTFMSLFRRSRWKARLLNRRNPRYEAHETVLVAKCAGPRSVLPTGNLGPEEKKFLLDLARTAITHIAAADKVPGMSSDGLPAKLVEPKACFVTLTEDGELRGCVGHIEPKEPLYQAVVDNAKDAASRDWRFAPVRPDEVDRIKIEISVLTRPQPVAYNSPEDLLVMLRPHEDGVVLKIGSQTVTFLPRVWDYYPDKAEFLGRLSEKAGYGPSAWKAPDTSVSVYHVESFEEFG